MTMSGALNLRPTSTCRFDLVSLGEVMLRLDPGEGRIHTTRSFTAWEGGGEYNVARGLRKCFGMRSAVVTAFADNEVGHLVEDFIMIALHFRFNIDEWGMFRDHQPPSSMRGSWKVMPKAEADALIAKLGATPL